MNYLRQEKCLRDHGACRGLILPVNPILGDIVAQAAAARLLANGGGVLGDGDGPADLDGHGEPDPDGLDEPDPDGLGEPDPDGPGEPDPDGLGEPTGGDESTGVAEGTVPGCGPDGWPPWLPWLPWPTPRTPVVGPCEGCGCAMARYKAAASPVRGLGPRPCPKPGMAWARTVEPADGANTGRMLFFPELA
jgi:hypothetical protein